MKTRLVLLIAIVGLVFSFQPVVAQDCVFFSWGSRRCAT